MSSDAAVPALPQRVPSITFGVCKRFCIGLACSHCAVQAGEVVQETGRDTSSCTAWYPSSFNKCSSACSPRGDRGLTAWLAEVCFLVISEQTGHHPMSSQGHRRAITRSPSNSFCELKCPAPPSLLGLQVCLCGTSPVQHQAGEQGRADQHRSVTQEAPMEWFHLQAGPSATSQIKRRTVTIGMSA